MNSHSWSDLGAAFDELAGQNPEIRFTRLEQIRAGSPGMADELSSLLEAHDNADGFFESRVDRILKSMVPGLVMGGPEVKLAAGEKVLHYEIIELLGAGSIGKVYLARDTELERLIALKVTQSQNKEARTLAHFSTEGIVQVHSEHVVERNGILLRLMCLEFIAGPTLSELGRDMRASCSSGKSLIQLLEKYPQRQVELEPTALKWRQLLASLTLPEAIALLGIRLAEILSHAHASGILHLDIKPANILIDPYGRPYLSDFNVSTDSSRINAGDVQGMGGTPHYMPPEQAKFFETGTADKLDARTDVFALGIVLRDLTAAIEFSDVGLDRILKRATEQDKHSRCESAAALARDLRAWLRGSFAEKEMPRLWRGFGWILKSPLWAVVVLTVASQLLASLINIGYNQFQIVSALSAEQNRVFVQAVGVYNLFVYPLLILFGVYSLRHLIGARGDIDRARRSVLRIPFIMFITVSVGWLPGAWIFPRVIDHFAGPLPASIYGQFAISIYLAWLVSLTTSLAVNLFILARALYPRFWRGRAELATAELRPLEHLNRFLTFSAALVPMAGVLLVVLIAPNEYAATDYRNFKIFLMVTVGFGLINLMLVQRITQGVDGAFAALKRPRTFD